MDICEIDVFSQLTSQQLVEIIKRGYPLTSVRQRGEEQFPDAAQPAVKLSLSGSQLMDSWDKTHDVVVRQHCTALSTAAHTADVTHLFTHTEETIVIHTMTAWKCFCQDNDGECFVVHFLMVYVLIKLHWICFLFVFYGPYHSAVNFTSCSH